MPRTLLFSRDVISHEHCGPDCDINTADPTCMGEVCATLVIWEKADGFEARLVVCHLDIKVAESHSDEKCLEAAAEYLGSYGLWISGLRPWKNGDKIEVTYRRTRSKDGIQARATLWAVVTKVTQHQATYRVTEIVSAEKFFRAKDIPMEGGFSLRVRGHDDIRRRE